MHGISTHLVELVNSQAAGFSTLIRNLGIYQMGQLCDGLLPAKIAHFRRDDLWHPLLNDFDRRSAGDLGQRHGGLHFTRQVGIFKAIGVAYLFIRHKLTVFAAEGMGVTGRIPPVTGLRNLRLNALWTIMGDAALERIHDYFTSAFADRLSRNAVVLLRSSAAKRFGYFNSMTK